MKIWLDDIRTPPDESWTWCKSAQEFEKTFVHHFHEIFEISFDHDLASFNSLTGDEITGYHCLCMVEKFARHNIDWTIPKMHVHSANPVGAQRMLKVINSLERW